MADIPASEREADPTTDLVPFGKYRGRPVTDLIADRNYVEWLLAQPWFADRQRPIYNLIIGSGGPEPQDTPEHNAMQARYLDKAPRLAIARQFLKNEQSCRSDGVHYRDKNLTDEQRANLVDNGGYGVGVGDAQFEVDGWDVIFKGAARLTGPSEITTTNDKDCGCGGNGIVSRYGSRFESERGCGCREHAKTCPRLDAHHRCSETCCRNPYLVALWGSSDNLTICVELKPTIGDDFPSILRSVVNRYERAVARRTWEYGQKIVVVADRITPSSVSVDQVRTMFKSRNVHLFTSDELS